MAHIKSQFVVSAMSRTLADHARVEQGHICTKIRIANTEIKLKLNRRSNLWDIQSISNRSTFDTTYFYGFTNHQGEVFKHKDIIGAVSLILNQQILQVGQDAYLFDHSPAPVVRTSQDAARDLAVAFDKLPTGGKVAVSLIGALGLLGAACISANR